MALGVTDDATSALLTKRPRLRCAAICRDGPEGDASALARRISFGKVPLGVAA